MQKSKNFNKELFEQLCREYNVESSTDYDKPMLKDSSGIHPINKADIRSLFPFYHETEKK